MGADINAFAERLEATGWEVCRLPSGGCVVSPCVGDRDRILFATLGAYRWCPHIEPIACARGLPPDLSALGR